MIRFDGIEVGIEGVEYAVGIPGEPLDDTQIDNLASGVGQVLHTFFEKELEFLRVTLDDIEYGLADHVMITPENISDVLAKTKHFLTTEVVKDMLNGN